ncbi:flagellin N-terminal helical domain-containing protein [Geodermatophilus sp. URMC 61]|uniref:flagellin N-terminal helical domain-containing protein n=1 Tax=Geodermatophilus sp. URMC 61 TaxID=3423411 RepID=UPI00406CF044
MGLRINQNIAAMNSYRNLSATDTQMSKSLEKLSSGFRINRAADDAAGLAISEGLRSQVGGLKVAVRNAQDGISVVQTAEGALTEVHSILQRLRDLAVQAGNDSNNDDSRAAIDTEATQLVSELDRIGKSTNFNGINLLDGSAGAAGKLNFQVGADGDTSSKIEVDLSGADVEAIAADLKTGALAVNATRFAVADPNLVGGTQTFTVTKGGVTSTVAVTLGAAGTYDSVDGLAEALRSNADFAANFSVSVEKDANGAGVALNVRSLDGGTIGTTTAPGTGVATGTTVASAAAGLDFSSNAAAQASITKLDGAIRDISTARAGLGALQNRFEHTINNLNVSVENLSASESRIRDADMAQEMMQFTRNQILSQAGTAMLAQANQGSQGVLQLLR